MKRTLTSGGVILLAVCACLVGCAPASLLITPVSRDQNLKETVLERQSALALWKVAVVDVDGMITNSRPSSITGFKGENPVSLFKEKLDKAADDPLVRAVVIRVNSPGGAVTASDLMYDEILAFKDRTGKPVVTCMLDLAASGGYYIACATDHIVAHPTTITGSIGVVMMTPNITGTLKKIGAEMHIFKSGAMKDAGSPFRPLTDEDGAFFDSLVAKMYENFVNVVDDGRPELSADKIRELADGRVYLGSEAKALGLVDSLGNMASAVEISKKLAEIGEANVRVVQYGRPLEHRPNYYAKTPISESSSPILNVELPGWLQHSTPQLLYLWAPGW